MLGLQMHTTRFKWFRGCLLYANGLEWTDQLNVSQYLDPRSAVDYFMLCNTTRIPCFILLKIPFEKIAERILRADIGHRCRRAWVW